MLESILKDWTMSAVEARHCGDGKICVRCEGIFILEDFCVDRSRSDGLNIYCKNCLKRQRLNLTPEQKQKKLAASARYSKTEKAADTRRKNWRRWHSVPSARFASSRSRAKRIGLSWTISKDQYFELIKNPCRYCGGPLPKTSTGLDRHDNRLGYDLNNISPCCALCNYARRDQFTVEEMVLFIGPAVAKVRAARSEVTHSDTAQVSKEQKKVEPQ